LLLEGGATNDADVYADRQHVDWKRLHERHRDIERLEPSRPQGGLFQERIGFGETGYGNAERRKARRKTQRRTTLEDGVGPR
jgi:hypothetical protein